MFSILESRGKCFLTLRCPPVTPQRRLYQDSAKEMCDALEAFSRVISTPVSPSPPDRTPPTEWKSEIQSHTISILGQWWVCRHRDSAAFRELRCPLVLVLASTYQRPQGRAGVRSATMPKGRKRAIKAARADEVEVRTAQPRG